MKAPLIFGSHRPHTIVFIIPSLGSLSSPTNLVYRAGCAVWSGSKWPGLMAIGMWRLMSFTQIWSTDGANVRSANPLTNSRDVRDTIKLLSLSPPACARVCWDVMGWHETAPDPDIYQLRAHSPVFVFSRGFFWCLNSSPGVSGWLALLGCMSSNKTEKRSKQIAGGVRSL